MIYLKGKSVPRILKMPGNYYKSKKLSKIKVTLAGYSLKLNLSYNPVFIFWLINKQR